MTEKDYLSPLLPKGNKILYEKSDEKTCFSQSSKTSDKHQKSNPTLSTITTLQLTTANEN